MLTPDTLTRHELAGLPVRVAAASGTQTGLAGRVLRETAQTLVIRTESGDSQVPKAGTVFEFAIGARLSARPAVSDLFGGPADGTGSGVVSGVSPPTDGEDRVESESEPEPELDPELEPESDGAGESSADDGAGAGAGAGADAGADGNGVGASETVQRRDDGDDSGREESSSTDEAADARMVSGTASKLGTETAGVRPRQSGPSADLTAGAAASRDGDATDGVTDSAGECEDVAYVTVDGSELVSRPAERSERGVSTWR
jgi:RNase P/RNase MRP subunit p29